VEGVKRIQFLALSVLLCARLLGACEAIVPKNPVMASEVCGYAQDPVGGRIADLDLKLVTTDYTTVSEVHTDAGGNFRFPTIPAGIYRITSGSKGWSVGGWLVQVRSPRTYAKCGHPLVVSPSLAGCGGGISKRGYRPKF
jgi:hypothetical protein